MALQFVDFDIVPVEYHNKIKEILEKEYEKIGKELASVENLRVHFKAHENEGEKKKYEIKFLLDYPGKPIAIDKNIIDWDPIIAVNKGMTKLLYEVEKIVKD